MIKQGNKINTTVIDRGSYQEMENRRLKPGEILEVRFKLNIWQKLFESRILQMKKEEFKEKGLEIIYYSYNQKTGQAVFQLRFKPSPNQNTLFGPTEIVGLSLVAITAVFSGYFLMKSTEYVFRKDPQTPWFGDWKVWGSLGVLAVAINNFLSEVSD